MSACFSHHSGNQTANLSLSGTLLGCCSGMEAGVVAWASCSALFCLLGCPACAAVLWELVSRRRAGTPLTPNDVFMLHLTVMDLLFLSFVPLGLCSFLLMDIHPLRVFSNFLYALNLAGRPLLTACVCLDCCLAVRRPAAYRRNRSLPPRAMAAAAVWAVTLAQGSAAVLVDEFQHGPAAMIVYAVALPVIVGCDASVLWALRTSRVNRGRHLQPWKAKALQVIANSLVMTLTSYLPPVLGYTLGELMVADPRAYECLVGIPILITPTAGSAIMPVLYLGNLRGGGAPPPSTKT